MSISPYGLVSAVSRGGGGSFFYQSKIIKRQGRVLDSEKVIKENYYLKYQT